MDNRNDTLTDGKRLRVCAPAEQEEFARLGQRLLANGVTEEELCVALGYDGVDGVRHALATGRITTNRLDRMRTLAMSRLGWAGLVDAKQGGAVPTPPPEGAAPTPPPSTRKRRAAPAVNPNDAANGDQQVLTKAQHRRLRDHVEHLWAVDSRFRSWPLLARVGGLASAQAMKRAYEVGASASTLRSVDTFCRLHAGFASRATIALQDGVRVEDLQDHLVRTRDEEQATSDDTMNQNTREPLMHADEGSLMATQSEKRESSATPAGQAAENGSGKETQAGSAGTRARGRKKEHLAPAQHQRLRGEIEALWERDERLRNWSLLSKAAGLNSGYAMKRAYDVNSSLTTLRKISHFAKQHARFGPATTDALKAGVATERLEDYLARQAGQKPAGRTPAARTPAAAQPAAQSAAADAAISAPVVIPAAAEPAPATESVAVAAAPLPTPAVHPAAAAQAERPYFLQSQPEAPPSVDFARMLEMGRAIDDEVERLWHAAQLFDGVANQRSLPRIVRTNAALARDQLRGVIDLFAGEGAGGQRR